VIFGLFSYIVYSLETFTRDFTQNIEAIFYFKDNVDQQQIDMLLSELKKSLLVKDITFVSKDQADSIFTRQFPDLKYILSEFKESPFPASIKVSFQQSNNMDTKIISLINDIEKLSIIESKTINLDWSKKVLALKKFISMVGIFLSLILIFISAFIIFNVIKINIFYRKDEINIFRIVGATDWYIKIPFIIEGAILGFFGSLLAGLLLYITLKLFPVYTSFLLKIIKDIINVRDIPLFIFARIIILGVGIGFISSYVSVRQFLKK
jgi:cell division transport system permease protein